MMTINNDQDQLIVQKLQKTGFLPCDYDLPYEDELEAMEASYQLHCDRGLLEADHYDSTWV